MHMYNVGQKGSVLVLDQGNKTFISREGAWIVPWKVIKTSLIKRNSTDRRGSEWLSKGALNGVSVWS